MDRRNVGVVHEGIVHEGIEVSPVGHCRQLRGSFASSRPQPGQPTGRVKRTGNGYFARPVRRAQSSTSGQNQTSPILRVATGFGKSGWRRRQSCTVCENARPRR